MVAWTIEAQLPALFSIWRPQATLGLPTIVGRLAEPSALSDGKETPGVEGQIAEGFSLGSGQHLQFGGSTISVGPCRAARIFPGSCWIGQSAYFAIWSIDLTPAATMPPWTRVSSRPCSNNTRPALRGGTTKNGKLAKRYLKQ